MKFQDDISNLHTHTDKPKPICPPLFSSPEPKAQGELIVYQSSRRLSVCVSVDIFKLEYPRNQWSNRNEILSEPSLGWGKGCIRFWDRSDRNSGVHGNG